MNKHVKNKVIGLAIFIVGCVGILYPIYNYDNVNIKYEIDQNNKPGIINLGSSHGNAFAYKKFNINGKRLNTGANTIYYDLQVYKLVQHKLDSNAVIVIPLSYYSFGVDENRNDKKGTNFVNQYYYTLPTSSIYDYSFSNHLDLITKATKDNLSKIIYGEHKNSSKAKPREVDVLKVISNINKNTKSNYNFKKNSLLRSAHHKEISKEENIANNLKYLNELVDLILENNHKPVLVVTPFHREYNLNFSKEWMNEYFLNNVNNISKKGGVSVLDYSKDKRFEKKDHLFHNQDHLNSKGEIYFTNIFFNDLKEKGISNKIFIKPNERILLENEKLTDDLILTSLKVKESGKNLYYLFEFNKNIVNYADFHFAFHLLNKKNVIMQPNNDIRKINKHLDKSTNVLTKMITKSDVDKADKIRFGFFAVENSETVRKSKRIILEIK